jgi:hypothetical protein
MPGGEPVQLPAAVDVFILPRMPRFHRSDDDRVTQSDGWAHVEPKLEQVWGTCASAAGLGRFSTSSGLTSGIRAMAAAIEG